VPCLAKEPRNQVLASPNSHASRTLVTSASRVTLDFNLPRVHLPFPPLPFYGPRIGRLRQICADLICENPSDQPNPWSIPGFRAPPTHT
jgi:hypothetical protein